MSCSNSGATNTVRRHPLTTHQRVVNELERRVFHELEPGSALPSESELSSELNVSRLTVREAVKSLQARGLIEVRHGRRPVVSRLSATAVVDFFTASVRNDPRNLLDMLDVRRALEPYAASLAARRVSRTASAAMTDALSAMGEAIDDPEAFDLADVRFHEGLAAASGNQILTFLIEAMAVPLRAGRVLSRRGDLARRRPLQQVIDEHGRIYECVMAGDSSGAAAAMQEHLTQTERSLRLTLEVPPSEGEPVQP